MTGFGKDGRGSILYYRGQITLGALNVNEAISAAAYALTEDFRILKMDLWTMAHTLAAGEEKALLLVGLADGELSDTEIAECLDSEPADSNDNVALERSHRPVWPLTSLRLPNDPETENVRYTPDDHITWTQRWTFSDTDGFELFVYNAGGEALTTGGIVNFLAKIYGVWVK